MEPPAPAPPPEAPNSTHEARVVEFRRLAAHFPALDDRSRSVALLVAQGYDPGAIAGDLRIKRFDVYQLLDAATARLRRAEIDNPTPPPALPPPQPAPDFSPILPIPTQAHGEEPDITEEDAGASTHSIPHGSTGAGRGRGRRTCRRCHQPGHNASTCELDLTEARVQDIAAACLRVGISAPPAPRSPIPVKEVLPEPEVDRPTWTLEDLDAIAALVPDQPEPPPPPPPVPEPEPERPPNVSDIKDRHRARTIRSPQRLTREERRAGEQLEAPEEVEMPLTRAECQQDPGRPCPWVRCKAHLYLDVNPETGAIKLNHPHLEVWEMAETCSNDVADRGPHTLEQVGALINVTRERVRQLEAGAGRNRAAKKIAEDVEFIDHDDGSPLASAIA